MHFYLRNIGQYIKASLYLCNINLNEIMEDRKDCKCVDKKKRRQKTSQKYIGVFDKFGSRFMLSPSSSSSPSSDYDNNNNKRTTTQPSNP